MPALVLPLKSIYSIEVYKKDIFKQTPRIKWELKSALKFCEDLDFTNTQYVDFEC